LSASRHISTDERIAEQAAHWLIDLEEDTADLSAFASWLQASPRHVEEFLLVSAVWQASDGIDAARRIDIDQLVSHARANVKWLDEDSPGIARAFNVRGKMQAALHSRLLGAVAVLSLASVGYWGFHDDSLQYRTSVGEQRIVKLEDGSIVTLNTRSRIKVRFEPQQRVVELNDGEALFEVAHDVQRPFRVIAGATTVRAVGTQFDVNRSSSATTVAVVQGIVELTSSSDRREGQSHSTNRPERLIAGEQAQLSARGELLQRSVAELDRVTSWKERRLVFRSQPLATIVAEFNRYTESQLTVVGNATGARLVSGVFDADNPAALIAFLERDPQLSIESHGKKVVIRGP
jgi:transmembrane sensor